MGRIADALARAEALGMTDRTSRSFQGDAVSLHWPQWSQAAAQDQPVDETMRFDTEEQRANLSKLGEEIVVSRSRTSVICEQYRSLRTRLLSANPRQEHRIHMVCSAVPRDGKSVTTVNLAFALAEVRHLRVLVVDADLRHSSVAGLLKVEQQPGLTEYLRGDVSYDEIVRPTALPNLFVVTAGRLSGRTAPDLLSSRAARSVFERFNREFNYTIVDTPPVTTVADVGIIGPLASGVVFVVRMHHTPEPVARHAIKALSANNIPVIGCLVVGDEDPTTGYGRRYEYYRNYATGPAL